MKITNMKVMRSIPLLLVALVAAGFTECYRPVTETGLPKDIRRIAVPLFQFEPGGARYRIESRFTDAVSREMLRRLGGLKIQGSREGADAVVEGTIRDFNFSGVLLDRDGRARVYEVTVTVAVTIRDLRNGGILYDNQNLVFKDSFEFSDDPRSFFNEEDPAVERMSRAFAESAVSTIVNGFGVRKEKD